jgi:ectoine hydroxylase-related dioxygenase (phytanoyl-CoA dioxygenase family)
VLCSTDVDDGRSITDCADELTDTTVDGVDYGGFCCVPGSHKGNEPMPAELRDLTKPENNGAPWLQTMSAKAGDAIIFTEALTREWNSIFSPSPCGALFTFSC